MKNPVYHNEPMTISDWLVDLVIAAGAFGFGCLQLTLAVNLLVPDEAIRRFLGIEAIGPTPLAIAVIAFTTLPLIVRRRFPWPVFLASLLIWVFAQDQMPTVSVFPVGPMIALFTLSLECSRAEALIAGIIGVLLIIIAPTAPQTRLLVQMTMLQNSALLVTAALAGYAMHTRQDYLKEAEERAHAAELTRETEAQRRVEEERVSIAREVHDITAHSLSAVSIQAAAAERLIDKDPAAAKDAIATVRRTSKTALDDIRAMIGVLRTGETRAESRPTEGTDRLGDLVAYLESAGISATLDDANYHRLDVPAHIDVALFGIAREACTNIVRHSKATYARIELRSDTLEACLSIEDNGRGMNYPERSEAGHGLKGMRERVRILGGGFQAGNRAQGGFSVAVCVPIARSEETL